MAEFSADRVPSLMPVRLSQRGGAAGAQAAQKASKASGPGRQLGRAAPKRQQQEQESVGRAAPTQERGPQDLNYLDLAMQHFNMKGLGRDIPYIVWANLTGNYMQYAQPGRPPFDYLEDA